MCGVVERGGGLRGKIRKKTERFTVRDNDGQMLGIYETQPTSVLRSESEISSSGSQPRHRHKKNNSTLKKF